MTLEIRKGSWNDLPQILALADACRLQLRLENIMQWDVIYPNTEVFGADIRSQTLFVAVRENNVVGTVALDFEQPDEYQGVSWQSQGKMMIVHRLCVDPRLHRQGIATALMDFAEQSALEQACSGVRLDAYSDNQSALTLYQSRNYQLAGQVFFPRREQPFYCFEKTLGNKK